MSFDVESLFTNVPVDEAVEIVRRRLQEDEFLDERCPLPVDTIVDLLELCLKSTYFLFHGQFYQQVDGVAMGSPVSPIVANIFMEEFEQKALATMVNPPRLWKSMIATNAADSSKFFYTYAISALPGLLTTPLCAYTTYPYALHVNLTYVKKFSWVTPSTKIFLHEN